MNLTELTYTKIKHIIRKFPRIRRPSFLYRLKQNENSEVEDPCYMWKTHAKLVERSVVHLSFVSIIPRFNKRRTRKERLFTCFYHIGGDFKAVLNVK